ncbi:MAG TPA: biopolymer transporter ExbD [Gammaproteobacteria bacterium]|jgi:biopolymer transport protein ExbD|nr:biopolymer transporter ExbD [Gammaproteobacteria bacterium]
MRKRRHAADGHESSHGIDLAPMLDFVINLLIFFIITAVFVKESGLTVNRPTSFEQERKEDSKSIQIQILDNGEIWVDNRAVDARAVRANVERLSAVNPDSGVLILAQEKAPTGTLVEVVDQVHLGGIYNITFSTTQ